MSPPVLYSSLVLGLKVCTTTAWFLWQLVWLMGLKVYVTTAWSVNLASEAVLLSELHASFIY